MNNNIKYKNLYSDNDFGPYLTFIFFITTAIFMLLLLYFTNDRIISVWTSIILSVFVIYCIDRHIYYHDDTHNET